MIGFCIARSPRLGNVPDREFEHHLYKTMAGLTTRRSRAEIPIMSDLEKLETTRLPFAELLGIKIVTAAPERATAEMMVRPELCTNPAVLHGGALMAFAETLGACATFLNLREGQGTTTIESKTNFLAPAPVGSKVTADCSAIHRGKRTMVWQTRISSEQGKLIGIVTQTQMVLDPPAPK
jgi:1,4-dihydroxy-2-naphthoyl-CoA hydrolase